MLCWRHLRDEGGDQSAVRQVHPRPKRVEDSRHLIAGEPSPAGQIRPAQLPSRFDQSIMGARRRCYDSLGRTRTPIRAWAWYAYIIVTATRFPSRWLALRQSGTPRHQSPRAGQKSRAAGQPTAETPTGKAQQACALPNRACAIAAEEGPVHSQWGRRGHKAPAAPSLLRVGALCRLGGRTPCCR